jgi:hypothetical protein
MPLHTSTTPIDPKRYAAHELLTDKQVGEWMNCTGRSARNWLAKHKIKPADVPGRTRRFKAGDVQSALDNPRSREDAA